MKSVLHAMSLLVRAGNASKIKALDLENIAKRYDSGELDPTVN